MLIKQGRVKISFFNTKAYYFYPLLDNELTAGITNTNTKKANSTETISFYGKLRKSLLSFNKLIH